MSSCSIYLIVLKTGYALYSFYIKALRQEGPAYFTLFETKTWGLPVSPEVVNGLLVDQEQNGKGQHEVRDLREREVSQEPIAPVVALHVGVGHRDEVVAPG